MRAVLLAGSLGLLGAPHLEEAVARDCRKIINKQRRRRCLQKAQTENVSFPVRAAFYNPWFPNAWKQGIVYPYDGWSGAPGTWSLLAQQPQHTISTTAPHHQHPVIP